MEVHKKATERFFRQSRVIAIIALAAVILVSFIIFQVVSNKVDSATYQLIRVESGESYVGKLSQTNSDYIELNDVYVYEAPAAKENKTEDSQNETSDNLTLLPVSSIKGTMYISRDKVIYWGNLASEGPVVNAIKSNKNKQD